jgi:hypothetical protein
MQLCLFRGLYTWPLDSDVGDTTAPVITPLDNLPLDHGSVRSSLIAGSSEHVKIPQLATYDLLPSGFTSDGHESDETILSVDLSRPDVALTDINYEHRNRFQPAGHSSTSQSNVDAAWPYTPVDQQSDASAYLQLPCQPLPPAWSIGCLSNPSEAIPVLHTQMLGQINNFGPAADYLFVQPNFDTVWPSTPVNQHYAYPGYLQLPYGTIPGASPFDPTLMRPDELVAHSLGLMNVPSNCPTFLQEPYQQLPLCLPTEPVVPHPSAPVALALSRQQPASLPVRGNDRLRCSKGCTRTFGRPGDLARHMKKHETPEFKCFARNCSRTFYRLDKLRDHAKQVHRLNL